MEGLGCCAYVDGTVVDSHVAIPHGGDLWISWPTPGPDDQSRSGVRGAQGVNLIQVGWTLLLIRSHTRIKKGRASG